MTDTEQVQTLFDKGGDVLIDRTYTIERPLLLPSNLRVYGTGTLQFIFREYTPTNFYLGNRDRGNDQAGNTNITFEGIKICGPSPVTPFGDGTVGKECNGFWFRKCQGIRLIGVEVFNVPMMGVVGNGVDNVMIDQCDVHHTGRDGIDLTGLVDDRNKCPLRVAMIRRNRLWELGDDAIACYSCVAGQSNIDYQPYISVESNIVQLRQTTHSLAQGRGCVLFGCRGEVLNNWFSGLPSNGLCFGKQANATTFTASDIRAYRNVIQDAGQWRGSGLKSARSVHGVYVKDAAHDISLEWNKIERSAGKPVMVTPDCERVVVS